MPNLPDINGPHTAASTAQAADLLAETVRVLNHATIPHNAADSLPRPQDVARLLGALGTTLERLPQLVGQIIDRLGDLENHPNLRAADSPYPTSVAEDAIAYLVGLGLGGDAAEIRRARSCVDRLYLDGGDDG